MPGEVHQETTVVFPLKKDVKFGGRTKAPPKSSAFGWAREDQSTGFHAGDNNLVIRPLRMKALVAPAKSSQDHRQCEGETAASIRPR